MTEPSVVDIVAARRRRSTKDRDLAEFALTQCEEAYFCRDWARFAYWFRVYRGARRRPRDDGWTLASRVLSNEGRRAKTTSGTGARFAGPKATTRFAKVAAAFLLLTVAVPTPTPAQTKSHSLSNNATVIASMTLPDLAAVPLYVKLIGGRLPSDAVNGPSTARGFFYQLSGTTEISVDEKTMTIAAGDATVIPNGAKVTFKAGYREPSVYLEFLLTPARYSDLPEVTAVNGREIYRSSSSIGGLHEGNYVLNLTRVTLPHQAPPDMPHHRSGAALHVVLSGFGAETADGTTVVKSPGSVSFEPAPLVYQWSNPGNVPLTYLVFNLNGETEDAVVVAGQSRP